MPQEMGRRNQETDKIEPQLIILYSLRWNERRCGVCWEGKWNFHVRRHSFIWINALYTLCSLLPGREILIKKHSSSLLSPRPFSYVPTNHISWFHQILKLAMWQWKKLNNFCIYIKQALRVFGQAEQWEPDAWKNIIYITGPRLISLVK